MRDGVQYMFKYTGLYLYGNLIGRLYGTQSSSEKKMNKLQWGI